MYELNLSTNIDELGLYFPYFDAKCDFIEVTHTDYNYQNRNLRP